MKILSLALLLALSACGGEKVPEPAAVVSMEGVKEKVARLQKQCMEKSKDDPNPESLKFRCGMAALKQVEGNSK